MVISYSSSTKSNSAESSTKSSPVPLPLFGRNANKNQLAQGKNNAISTELTTISNVHYKLLEYQSSFAFACPLCPKKFSTSQALGGHQNAHRKERHIQKRIMAEFHQGETTNKFKGKNKSPFAYDIFYHNNSAINDHQECFGESTPNTVYDPEPLRAAYPLINDCQISLSSPVYQSNHPSWDEKNPNIVYAKELSRAGYAYPITDYMVPSSSHEYQVNQQPSCGLILRQLKPSMTPYQASYPGLVAEVTNMPSSDGPSTQPFFPVGFGGMCRVKIETDHSLKDTYQLDVALTTKDREEEDHHAKEWGIDLQLKL